MVFLQINYVKIALLTHQKMKVIGRDCFFF